MAIQVHWQSREGQTSQKGQTSYGALNSKIMGLKRTDNFGIAKFGTVLDQVNKVVLVEKVFKALYEE